MLLGISNLVKATLTVRESLMFYANLHLDIEKSAKEKRVDNLIQSLALASCADTIIGDERRRGISGGEMKRVAIGISMITDPSVYQALV